MSCKPINLTNEQIRNIFSNKDMFWSVTSDLTMDELLARLDFFQTNMILPEGDNQKYIIGEHKLAQRVSDKSKGGYIRRVGKSEVERQVNKPNFEKQRKAGTRIHAILADTMESLYNGVGDLAEVRRNAALGDYAVKGANFDSLLLVVREIIRDVEKIQKSIDPSKKAIIKVEQKMASARRDIGGTLDILVIFSDKSHGRIDYKTSTPHSYNFLDGQLIDDLLGMNKVQDYTLSMDEYGKILTKDIGLGPSRMARLVPIMVQLGLKDQDESSEFDYYTTDLVRVDASSKDSPFLKQIPIIGEITEYKGIDKLLEKQWQLLEKLTEKLHNKNSTTSDKETLRRQIRSLRKAIQSAIVDDDISDILTSAELLYHTLNNRLKESELFSDGKENPSYLTDRELDDAIDELLMYKDIIENTHKYYGDLKTKDPELYKKLVERIKSISGNVSDVLVRARVEREERFLTYVPDQYKDKDGNLVALEELDFFTRNFTRFSEIDHPMFKIAWGMIQDSYHKMRQDLKTMSDEVTTVENALFKWAKDSGIDRLDALKLIINTDAGHLYSEISADLMQRISKAFSNPDPNEGQKELEAIYRIKDIEAWKESYALRLEKFKETQSTRYEQGLADKNFQKDLKTWKAQNDMLNSPNAWFNRSNRHWLEIKPEVKEAHISPEYRKIKATKPLLDYYNMYVKYNDKFRRVLGVDYATLPSNFIPNIRKTMVDHMSMDKLNVVAAGQEFFDSLSVRDEDTYISDVDSTGNVRRSIPILFLNPFRNKDGEIDNTRKSYDLSKSLLLFGKMAYNYKYMYEIEPKIMQIRQYMADPTSQREGTKVTDKSGRTFRGITSEWATKKGADTDTYKLFEELTDFYLYGIKFHGSNLKGTNIDTTKLLLKMKQYYGKSTLAFAVIPGAAAWIGGGVSRTLEGIKGVSYDKKGMAQAGIHLTTDHDKYTALSLFYNVYAEDPTTALIESKSANFWSKMMTYRNMMYPLRKADELTNDHILNAMALNWGIDTEGKLGKKNALVRLNDPSRDTRGIKNLWELTTFDKESGKVTVQGLTDDNYIAFRNAVKATSANVIGSLSQEDISRIDTNLLYNIMFQFKSWMPGVIRERTGKLTYDDKLQAARWGRYRAAFSEFKNIRMTDDEVNDGFKLTHYMSSVFLPNLSKFILDLSTFGLAPKMGLVGDSYVDASGKTRRVRTNVERARRMYKQYLLDNPSLVGRLTFENFLEIKEAQMRAFSNELRALILFTIALSFLGGSGDDGKEPPYMANWFSRFMYKNFTKAQSELSFMWSPAQFTQLIRNPIPMTGLLTRGINTTMNGFDETRDLLGGEDSLNDQTPMGYYTLQWIYGGGQIARLVELYKQYEKSPYVVVGGTY